MISLNIEDYCNNCDEFEPDVNKRETLVGFKKRVDISITCNHADRCRLIANYIREETNEQS